MCEEWLIVEFKVFRWSDYSGGKEWTAPTRGTAGRDNFSRVFTVLDQRQGEDTAACSCRRIRNSNRRVSPSACYTICRVDISKASATTVCCLIQTLSRARGQLRFLSMEEHLSAMRSSRGQRFAETSHSRVEVTIRHNLRRYRNAIWMEIW